MKNYALKFMFCVLVMVASIAPVTGSPLDNSDVIICKIEKSDFPNVELSTPDRLVYNLSNFDFENVGTGEHFGSSNTKNSAFSASEIQKAGFGFMPLSSWLLMLAGSFAQKIRKTPTSSQPKAFIQYADNWNGNGTACAHFRTEDGKIIKLYPGEALTAADATAPNSGDAPTDLVISNIRTRLGELEAVLVANGLLL